MVFLVIQPNLGSLYIPPSTPENSAPNKAQLTNQTPPAWMATRDSREKAEWVDGDNQQRSATTTTNTRQPPPPNRWGNNTSETIVSPTPDSYQNATQNQIFNNTKTHNLNDGPKVI